jgi:hypothetical protein
MVDCNPSRPAPLRPRPFSSRAPPDDRDVAIAHTYSIGGAQSFVNSATLSLRNRLGSVASQALFLPVSKRPELRTCANRQTDKANYEADFSRSLDGAAFAGGHLYLPRSGAPWPLPQLVLARVAAGGLWVVSPRSPWCQPPVMDGAASTAFVSHGCWRRDCPTTRRPACRR